MSSSPPLLTALLLLAVVVTVGTSVSLDSKHTPPPPPPPPPPSSSSPLSSSSSSSHPQLIMFSVNNYTDFSGQLHSGAAHWAPKSLFSAGFIHACTAAQMKLVLSFAAFADVLLVPTLVVNTSLLAVPSALKWQQGTTLPPSDGLFPHLYAPLNFDAIARIVTLYRQPDSTWQDVDVRQQLQA